MFVITIGSEILINLQQSDIAILLRARELSWHKNRVRSTAVRLPQQGSRPSRERAVTKLHTAIN